MDTSNRPTFGRAQRTFGSDNLPEHGVSTRRELDIGETDSYAEKEPIEIFKRCMQIACGILGLFWIESLFSGTELITPINKTFEFTMIVIGGVLGIPFGIFTVIAKTSENMGYFKKGLVVLTMPLFCAGIFYGISWRITDWKEFGFSNAAFEEAVYPIKGYDRGRKGRRASLEINPFGAGTTNIPIPHEQYLELSSDYDADLCVKVWQRRSASGAIEVKTDGQYVLNDPQPAVISQCDGEKSETHKPIDPWS